jgi:guanine deaminase
VVWIRARRELSFGSDVGGGNRFCMRNVLDDAYKVGMANNAKLDDPEAERNKLSAYRGFTVRPDDGGR